MAHECVSCRQPTAPGALVCPHCGAERPHRQRPVRAHALARRRQLLLVAVLAGLLVVVAVVYLSGGTKRSRDCRDFDSATARYDQAITSGVDPADEQLVALREEVERLRVACTRSEG